MAAHEIITGIAYAQLLNYLQVYLGISNPKDYINNLQQTDTEKFYSTVVDFFKSKGFQLDALSVSENGKNYYKYTISRQSKKYLKLSKESFCFHNSALNAGIVSICTSEINLEKYLEKAESLVEHKETHLLYKEIVDYLSGEHSEKINTEELASIYFNYSKAAFACSKYDESLSIAKAGLSLKGLSFSKRRLLTYFVTHSKGHGSNPYQNLSA